MQFEIIPHKGIGPVDLKMNREKVLKLMDQLSGGPPVRRHNSIDCFFQNSFQISYNEQGLVEFIEVGNNPEFVYLFEGLDVFDVPAKKLLQHIKQFDSPDPELSIEGHEYLFPSLILTLWDIGSQYDHRGGQKRPMFAAIGIGDLNYLKAIRAIKA
jgi:hypothetical protein